jgi:hypothetical protein
MVATADRITFDEEEAKRGLACVHNRAPLLARLIRIEL